MLVWGGRSSGWAIRARLCVVCVYAVMLFLSGFLLFYTAIIVPVQICMWSYDDPCNMFPTLQFDIIVDSFFLVSTTISLSQQK